MFKKMTLTIIALSIFTFAESPIQIEKSDFWWKISKESTTKLLKSIKINIDWERLVDMTKDLTNKTIDKTKEFIEDKPQTKEDNNEYQNDQSRMERSSRNSFKI